MKYLLPLFISFALATTFKDTHATINQETMSTLSNVNNICPDSLDSPYNVSSKLIKIVVTSESANRIEERVESGINHLEFDELELLISPVDNDACTKLNDFREDWLEEKPNTEYTYYKIDNYYFVVAWYNGNMMGFQPVFVFNSNFDLVGLWSI